MLDCSKLRVLITGAASGLGAALAKAFASRGAKVWLTDIREERLREVHATLTSETRGAIRSIAGDLAEASFIADLAQKVQAEDGWVDILINNAALIRPGRIGHTAAAAWEEVLKVNLLAPCLLLNELATAMNEHSQAPLVVNISSVAALQGAPYEASYVVSKAGLQGLSAAVNEEYSMFGRIRAMTVCPGNMETEIWRHTEGWPGISRTPRDRLMKPDTVAEAIARWVEMSDELDLSQCVLTPRKDLQDADNLVNPKFKE